MANQNGVEEGLSTAVNKTELFFEANGRKMIYILFGLLIAAAAVYGYRAVILEPRAERAAEMMAQAQVRFDAENPDFALALNGDANGAGFLEVIDQYGSTPAGNLAKHYAGICYLRTGDLANAQNYLAKFSLLKGIPGALVNAQNFGLQGDIAVDELEYAKAVKFYNKAVKAADNSYTAPLYLRKAGLAELALGDKAKAAEYFQQILTSYPSSMDAREAEKLLGRVNN